jgi:hypothetical protein
MEVFIKIEFGDRKTITIVVDADNTLNMVKGIVKNMEGIPRNQQRLIFADETLEDDRTLTDYNILDGSTLDLVFLTEFKGWWHMRKHLYIHVYFSLSLSLCLSIYIYIHISLCL